MKHGLTSRAVGMILIVVLAVTGCGDTESLLPKKTDQVVIRYDVPTKPAQRQIYDLLRGRQSLEKLKDFLSPFRPRWPLHLPLTECGGEADAYYGDDEISI